jgi:uncharacterized small protein (DUF1192 family)
MKISSDVRKHWRTVCTSNTQTDSGVSMRGINKILDDVEELEREIERLKAQVERLRAPLSKSEAAELNNAGNAMNKLSEPYHKCVNRIIASRAAEKGGEA